MQAIKCMNRLHLILLLIYWLSILSGTGAYAAKTCDQVFTSTKPFSVSLPNLMGRIQSQLLYTNEVAYSFSRIIPLAHTHQDFLDLFASFNENKVPLIVQKKLLQSHPIFRSYRINDQLFDSYISNFNAQYLNSSQIYVDSPLYNEITSPKVIDQCATGTCWINSSTSMLESVLTIAERPNISEHYLYLESLIERAKESSISGSKNFEGGNMYAYMYIIQKKGYVETKDWQPKFNIYKHRERILRPLKNLADKYRPLFKLSQDAENLSARFVQEAEELLSNIVGPFPDATIKKAIPKDLSVEFFHRNISTDSITEALEKISKTIDGGHEVMISLKSNTQDFRQKNIVNFATGKGNSNHAMVVVGYVKDAYGNVQLLKIKNSWGQKIGLSGYIYLSRSFLYKTFNLAAVFKKN